MCEPAALARTTDSPPYEWLTRTIQDGKALFTTIREFVENGLDVRFVLPPRADSNVWRRDLAPQAAEAVMRLPEVHVTMCVPRTAPAPDARLLAARFCSEALTDEQYDQLRGIHNVERRDESLFAQGKRASSPAQAKQSFYRVVCKVRPRPGSGPSPGLRHPSTSHGLPAFPPRTPLAGQRRGHAARGHASDARPGCAGGRAPYVTGLTPPPLISTRWLQVRDPTDSGALRPGVQDGSVTIPTSHPLTLPYFTPPHAHVSRLLGPDLEQEVDRASHPRSLRA